MVIGCRTTPRWYTSIRNTSLYLGGDEVVRMDERLVRLLPFVVLWSCNSGWIL